MTVDDLGLGDPELWLRPDRDAIVARLRTERPVSVHGIERKPIAVTSAR